MAKGVKRAKQEDTEDDIEGNAALQDAMRRRLEAHGESNHSSAAPHPIAH